ncbi:Rho guanine nucleotide exchange factor 10 [Armadillidium vulgare]|nr:Rho guanine nucleotide exchange factor 10 [Armadillidium vulgare]
MVWVDSCCLQFCIKTKDGKEKETFTFQTDNPTVKKDWIVELRLAQLALDRNNSPAWDLPDHVRTPSTKLPLFVKALPVFSSKHQTEVKCGCFYSITSNRPSRGTGRQMMYLWLCSSDGVSSHLTVFQMQQVGLREIVKIDLTEMCVSALQHVPALGTGASGNGEESLLRSHTVWMGTDSHRLLVYSGIDPEKQVQLSSTSVSAAITTIKYHCDQVFVGLSNGNVQVYRRGTDGAWLLSDPIIISLGLRPITALLPISTHVYASCGNQVYVIDCFTAQVTKEFGVQHDDSKEVFLMAHSGIGLWIAQKHSSTICLYHTETFRHLQDINVASNVSRMLSETGNTQTPTKIYVTALMASKGLLWVGTNVGVVLTIPLPRLEGIPIISGRANISFHAHLGPITFLLALHSQTSRPMVSTTSSDLRFSGNELNNETNQFHSDGRSSTVPPTPSARLEKQQSDGNLLLRKPPQPKLKQQLSSPIMVRRRSRESREQSRRLSKTLPRNVGGMALSGSQECDVYGLCGALLNVQNYEEEAIGGVTDCGGLNLSRYDSMRRSDPELAIPEQLNTLDRRVRLKASRPRSLDLSTWSVDSRASSACTTASSGSEEGPGGGLSPCANKRSSNGGQHRQRVENSSTLKRKEMEVNRTLMVVMGGRGYISWQKRDPSNVQPNTKDAHIVVWEMKL